MAVCPTTTSPEVGRSIPVSMFSRVDLPLPDLPTTAINSPFLICNSSFAQIRNGYSELVERQVRVERDGQAKIGQNPLMQSRQRRDMPGWPGIQCDLGQSEFCSGKHIQDAFTGWAVRRPGRLSFIQTRQSVLRLGQALTDLGFDQR